jgi:hypothetical protein
LVLFFLPDLFKPGNDLLPILRRDVAAAQVRPCAVETGLFSGKAEQIGRNRRRAGKQVSRGAFFSLG